MVVVVKVKVMANRARVVAVVVVRAVVARKADTEATVAEGALEGLVMANRERAVAVVVAVAVETAAEGPLGGRHIQEPRSCTLLD